MGIKTEKHEWFLSKITFNTWRHGLTPGKERWNTRILSMWTEQRLLLCTDNGLLATVWRTEMVYSQDCALEVPYTIRAIKQLNTRWKSISVSFKITEYLYTMTWSGWRLDSLELKSEVWCNTIKKRPLKTAMSALSCNSCNMKNSFKWCKMSYVDLYIYEVSHHQNFL